MIALALGATSFGLLVWGAVLLVLGVLGFLIYQFGQEWNTR